LSKIPENASTLRENLGKIFENIRKITENLGKPLENTGKNGAQRCLILKNWNPTCGITW